MEAQVVKFQNNTELSESQKLRSALTTSTMICELQTMEVDGALSAIIDKSIFYLGLNTPIEDRKMIKELVLADVVAHFKRLTILEVVLYIDNGAHGRYGDVRGLAPKDVFNWIQSGATSQERKEHVAELAKQNEPKPEPTEEQKRQLRWVNMLNAWATYKKDGAFNDHGNAVYNTLVNTGRIDYGDELMADFIRIAKVDLMKEYNPLQHIGNFVKASECKAIIAEIINGGDENTRVIVAAKKQALNHFFKGLAEMEMEITDLFN
jgi:hypothetical protein